MKFVLWVGILAILSAVTVPHVAAQSSPLQQGTIVSLQKQNITTPAARPGAAGALHPPLQTTYYRYAVSVGLNCVVYNLRYESEFDDLPSVLAVNNQVSVRLKKNVMYLDLSGRTLEMRIVRRKASKTACDAK